MEDAAASAMPLAEMMMAGSLRKLMAFDSSAVLVKLSLSSLRMFSWLSLRNWWASVSK
jgi:hypothetical protein